MRREPSSLGRGVPDRNRVQHSGKDIHEDTVVFITSEEFCIEQIPNKTELREEDDDKR